MKNSDIGKPVADLKDWKNAAWVVLNDTQIQTDSEVALLDMLARGVSHVEDLLSHLDVEVPIAETNPSGGPSRDGSGSDAFAQFQADADRMVPDLRKQVAFFSRSATRDTPDKQVPAVSPTGSLMSESGLKATLAHFRK